MGLTTHIFSSVVLAEYCKEKRENYSKLQKKVTNFLWPVCRMKHALKQYLIPLNRPVLFNARALFCSISNSQNLWEYFSCSGSFWEWQPYRYHQLSSFGKLYFVWDSFSTPLDLAIILLFLRCKFSFCWTSFPFGQFWLEEGLVYFGYPISSHTRNQFFTFT